MEKKDIKNPVEEMESVDMYPGVQDDVADDETVDKKLTRQDTRELNDNPRNNDM